MCDDHKGYYAALGVAPTASSEEVKKAYRQMALQFHPDKNPAEDAKLKFQTISEAHAVLSDDDARAAYDRGQDDAEIDEGADISFFFMDDRDLTAAAVFAFFFSGQPPQGGVRNGFRQPPRQRGGARGARRAGRRRV